MATTIIAKKRHEHLSDNAHWRVFTETLEKRGVRINFLWQAKSSPSLKHPDVHCISFFGEGARKDAPIAIVRDYCTGKPIGYDYGYGLYLENSNRVEDDVEAVCQPRT